MEDRVLVVGALQLVIRDPGAQMVHAGARARAAGGLRVTVVDAIAPERPARRSRARWLTPRWLGSRLAPALATAAVTAAALIAVYADDRRTAERYRETLAQADGQYFQAEPLRDETGARGGVAFGYEGSPSWVFLTIDPE
jgi:hypothetical protein